MSSKLIKEIETKAGFIKTFDNGMIVLPKTIINYDEGIDYIAAIQKAIESIRNIKKEILK